MKTSELTGALLDYWVAQIEGMLRLVKTDDILFKLGGYSPSTKWTQGGPIIERERMKVEPLRDGPWTASARTAGFVIVGAIGDTALIAAMRAYVASKFGDEVPDTEKVK